MHKVISALKWFFSNFSFFLTFAAGVAIYLWWFRIAPQDSNCGFIYLLLYGLAALFWKRTKKHSDLKTFLLLASLFLLLINAAYIYWYRPFLVSSVKCNGTTYFLTYHPSPLDWSYYQITKWRGTSYKEIYWGYTGIFLDKMICDERTNEVKVFNNTDILFSDSISDSKPVTHFDSLDVNELGGLSYRLFSYVSSDSGDRVQKYLLTICEPDKPETCQYIPIDHSSRPVDNEQGNLIVDLGAKEIYILFDGKIYFAYGNETQKFDSLAFEKRYYVAGYFKDNAYIYILYRCTLYKEYCDYIPFSYSTVKSQDIKLELDTTTPYYQETHKLSVYIGGNLVFIYKMIYEGDKCQNGCPESRCLVAGCTTPGQ